jgi:hypothetical protein
MNNGLSLQDWLRCVIRPRQRDLFGQHIIVRERHLQNNAAAESFLVTFERKQRWAESDIAQAGERLEDADHALLSS